MMKKNLQKDLEVIKKPLTFAPASMKITLHECESSYGGLMMKKKSFKKIWRFEKLALPLHHFPTLRSGVVTEMKFRTKLE